MQDQLRADKKAEEEMFDKLSCWCKVNGDGKTEAVATAEASLASLSSQMKALAAKSSELDSSIKSLEAELEANTQALKKATSMREKEHAEFNSNEKELILSIDSLKNALVVMAKSQGEMFLQTQLRTVRSRVQDVVDRTADDLLSQILTPSSRSTLNEFLQANPHTPQSGEIMGVLKQMRVEFADNLKDMQEAESKAASEFEALDEAKSSEIAAGEKMIKEKTAQLGRTKVALAEASEDHEDTTNAMESDQAFLVDLKERCAQSDADWEARSATRAKEMQAVSEAIGILTDEDAHDLFHKTLSFIQLSSTRRVVSKAQRARESASRILMRQASKTGNRALVQLAASARLDGFDTVTKDIEGMISDLREEQAAEVKHKDYCNTEFHNNEMETMRTNEVIKDLDTKINDFGSNMGTLAQELDALHASVADAEVELQKANMNRKAQNVEFQQVVADQRATQVILKKAKDRLSQFYEFVELKEHKVAIKQPNAPGAAAPPPPQGFSDYKSNAGSGSVMTMLEGIITDASEAEKEAITAENDAEAAYHAFLKESFNAIEEAQRAVTNKVEQNAKAESSKVAAAGDLDAAKAQLASLGSTKQELHASCDFVLQNFDARQAARNGEVEGLQNAVAALRTA